MNLLLEIWRRAATEWITILFVQQPDTFKKKHCDQFQKKNQCIAFGFNIWSQNRQSDSFTQIRLWYCMSFMFAHRGAGVRGISCFYGHDSPIDWSYRWSCPLTHAPVQQRSSDVDGTNGKAIHLVTDKGFCRQGWFFCKRKHLVALLGLVSSLFRFRNDSRNSQDRYHWLWILLD